jgi:hypothetical protein
MMRKNRTGKLHCHATINKETEIETENRETE